MICYMLGRFFVVVFNMYECDDSIPGWKRIWQKLASTALLPLLPLGRMSIHMLATCTMSAARMEEHSVLPALRELSTEVRPGDARLR